MKKAAYVRMLLRAKSVFVGLLAAGLLYLACRILIYPKPGQDIKAFTAGLSENWREKLGFTSVEHDKNSEVATIQFFNASSESQELRDFANKHECVKFVSPRGGAKICVHPREVDKYVSGSLITSGSWEAHLVRLMEGALSRHPGIVLLDLGCNIGVFTIYAVKMGVRVVAIDANIVNLMLLSRSLDVGSLHQNVTLIWNAVSDVHENVILKEDPGNNGGMFVESWNQTYKTYNNSIVKTITLNDLAFLFKTEKSVFIKIDIEGSELKALKGGVKFFNTVNVGYVLMEMMWHRKRRTGKEIYHVMTGLGFRPYPEKGRTDNVLQLADIEKWPDNVLWSRVPNN